MLSKFKASGFFSNIFKLSGICSESEFAFFTFLLIITQYIFPQPDSNTTILIVHGAWGGGWSFKKVDEILTKKGAKVYRPTLSGLGEKLHLLSENINRG